MGDCGLRMFVGLWGLGGSYSMLAIASVVIAVGFCCTRCILEKLCPMLFVFCPLLERLEIRENGIVLIDSALVQAINKTLEV